MVNNFPSFSFFFNLFLWLWGEYRPPCSDLVRKGVGWDTPTQPGLGYGSWLAISGDWCPWGLVSVILLIGLVHFFGIYQSPGNVLLLF